MGETTLRYRKLQEDPHVRTSEENVVPTSKSAGWSVFVQILITLLTVPLVYIGCVFLFFDLPFEPKDISLPEPPEWTGALAENNDLQRTEHLFHNQVLGPESVVFDHGHIYASAYDGKVIHIEQGVIRTLVAFGSSPCGGINNEPNCGRPLGMRMDRDKYLVVLDAYKGLFRVNVATGDSFPYFSSDIIIDGEKPKFLNDLDIDSNGVIYFTDSSTNWQRNQLTNIIFGGDDSGRLIKFDPERNTTEVLLKGLHFANGVQISRNKEYILVCETSMARIQKYYLKGPKAGQSEIFADNMPGYPDNIRLSTSGGYWVGMSMTRRAGLLNIVEFVHRSPFIKRFLLKAFSPETVLSYTARIGKGLLVQVNESGAITRTLHDPSGNVVQSISEVHDHHGILYLGSYKAPFIGKLDITKKV